MVKERIQHLLGALNKGIYEKDTELALSLLAALAGESIYDGADYPKGARQVYLTRDEEGIYIDGVHFYIEPLGRGEKQSSLMEKGKASERDFYQEIEQLGSDIMRRKEQILGNILISQKDKQEIAEIVSTLMKEVAYTRQDTEKLEA